MNAAALTLRTWFEQHFIVLYMPDARPRTIENYNDTLSLWETHTTNPTINIINPYLLAEFRAKIMTGRSPSTVNKHAKNLNALFAKLGPPGPRNRDALGIIDHCLWLKPPRPRQRIPRVPRDDQVAQLLTMPHDLALFAVTAALTGSRQTAIRSLTTDDIDYREQVIRFADDTDKEGRPRLKPVPAILIRWWKQLGHLTDHWRTTRKSFNRRWKKWMLRVDAGQVLPHDLKRWWGAQLIRIGASPWAVRYALDHAQRDVTGIHYLAPFDELAGLVDRIPLPPAFMEVRRCIDARSCPSQDEESESGENTVFPLPLDPATGSGSDCFIDV